MFMCEYRCLKIPENVISPVAVVVNSLTLVLGTEHGFPMYIV